MSPAKSIHTSKWSTKKKWDEDIESASVQSSEFFIVSREEIWFAVGGTTKQQNNNTIDKAQNILAAHSQQSE